jgi:hypothetical protein
VKRACWPASHHPATEPFARSPGVHATGSQHDEGVRQRSFAAGLPRARSGVFGVNQNANRTTSLMHPLIALPLSDGICSHQGELMKKYRYIIFGILVLPLLIAGGFYLFVVLPGQAFIEDNKPKLVNVANNFMECLLNKNAEECRQTLASEEFKKAASAEALNLLLAKMQKSLSERTVAIPIDKSFTWTKFAGSNGVSFTVSFVLNVPYEHDEHATEQWTVVREGEGPFLVQTFRINSNEMIK